MDRDAQHLAALDALLTKASQPTQALQQAMDYLHGHRDDYHWVGIYRLEGDTLILGPYNGPETDHARIPVGRGVCGTAVAENRNQVVPDVRALTNYLACNLETRSEIVVLIRDPENDRILGQIDVDGPRVNQFGREEERFLTAVAKRLAPLLAKG
jgi:GAF domain-containing protein